MSNISIHAPREGCDDFEGELDYLDGVFQSTHPVRGATRLLDLLTVKDEISIHAPREGCDLPKSGLHVVSLNFNPRTP